MFKFIVDIKPPMPGQTIKGIILKSRLEFLENHYGDGYLDKLLPHLTGEARTLMSNPKKIRATSWYDIKINFQIDNVIRDVFANGDNKIFWKMGSFTNDFKTDDTGRHAYKDPWKFLVLHTGVMPRFWKPGRAELIRVNDNEAIIRFHVTESTRGYCLTNLGFFKSGLEISGAKDVEATETQCVGEGAEYCEYRFRFKK
jgi:hypothetical protein